MNIYTGLLFQQGFIQNSRLAVELAGEPDMAPRIPARPAPELGIDARARPTVRRGAMTTLCSIALSPFR